MPDRVKNNVTDITTAIRIKIIKQLSYITKDSVV